MGFQQGLSGLNSSSKALDTIGNNISNASTVGFKSAATQFADVYASSLSGGAGNQIGIGSSLSRVSQQFTQGNVTNTNNPLDMAINGSGFYRMSGNGTITYSRGGQFQLDKDGFVTASGGLKLTGYSSDPITGTISPGNLVPLQVVNTNIAPQVTSASQIQLNLDSRAVPPSAMSSGSLTGAAALPALTTITQGTNDVLDLVVDGINVSVTVPPSTTYTAGGLVSTLQSLINGALTGTGASVTVNNSAGGQLTITSNSKGSLGSAGAGSSVTLNGLGGPAANTLLGAPVAAVGTVATGAKLSGGMNLPTTVTIGSGESFSFSTVVAAGPTTTTQTVSLPAGTYATTGAPAASAFQTMLQTAVDAAFPPAGTLTVAAASGAPTSISLTAPAAGDTVSIGAMTAGIQAVFGPTTVVGKDNFNQISGLTSGTLTGGTALNTVATVPTITAAINDTLNVTVDGHAISVTLTAAGPYDNSVPGKMLTDLALDVQTQVNNALAAVLPATTARVTASINASNKLVIQSNSTGTSSTVAVGASAGGTAATTLFGAAPAAVAGNQTQTVNPLGFTASTAQTVYDSQGNAHNLSLYFAKTSEGNIWQMYSTLDNGQQQGPTTLTFNGTGTLLTPMPITLPAQGSSYIFTSSAANASTPNPLQFTLDLSGTTQYGVSFGVNTLSQDGFASGQLSGISVASNGVIQGRYSNGKTKNMGQVVLVSFNNPNGLQSLGGNQWSETTESGQPIPGAPGTGNLGLVQSAAVEESNVDLTKELVDMITQQRVYQANAQTIKTIDSVLQTLVNLR